MAEETTQTANEYINHHLQFLTYGKHPDGSWGLAHSPEEAAEMGFMAVNLDTLGWSVVLGVLFLGAFRIAAKRVTVGVPGGFQNFIEWLIEWIEGTVKDTFHGSNPYIGPIGLTIFCWVVLMNTMDLIPVDWLPLIAQRVSGDAHTFFKVVPSTDINITFGMSFSVFFMMIYYSIKVKGVGGYAREFLCHPFGKWLFPINLILELPGYLARPISLSLRLYGNFFAGEMIFLIIASMLGYWQLPLHFPWAVFHLLIVLIQAYLFMMLTIVYLSQAHEDH